MTKGEKKDERVRTEGKYKALVETAADAIFTLDLLGRFTFANPAAERISGYSEEELVGRHFRELLPPKHIPACLNAFQKALRGKPTSPIEIEMITKEGERVPLELLGRPVKRGRRIVEVIGIARDITERKRAEQLYRSVVELAPDSIMTVDMKGVITSCNTAATRILGYSKDELVGKQFSKIGVLRARDIPKYLKLFKSALRGELTEPLELSFRRKDGTPILAEVRVALLKSGGKTIGLQAVSRDITERKRAEDALRESEERFQSLSASAPVGILLTDAKGQCIYTNPRLQAITGLTLEESLGDGWNQAVHPDDRRAALEEASKRASEGGELSREFRILTPQGELHWVHVRSTPMLSQESKQIGRVGTVEDITERKRAEEALRESKEKYRTILENIEDGYYEVDIAGNLTFFNDALCRVLGYPEDELMGMNNRQYMDDETAKAVYQTFNAVYRTGKPTKIFDYGIIRKDGTRRSVETSVSLINGSTGEPVGFRGIVRDITERRRAEEAAQKRLREITALHRVSKVINSSLELHEIFQRVVKELSQTFDYRLVDIYLLEEEGLRLQAQVGYDAETTIDFTPLERGVVGRVARTGQPAFIPDVSQDPDYIHTYPDITSEICVPVKSGETLLGTLNVESDAKRPLTVHDLQLLSTLSSHIGVAIENARLYEDEQRRSAQRRTIAEVGRKAAAFLEMDTLLPQVVDLIAQNFGYYRVSIFQVNADSGYALYKAGTGMGGVGTTEEGFRLRIGEEGLVGWVALHGQPLLVNDVSQDPRYYFHPELPDTRSELDVPIRVGERVIGVLNVQSAALNAFDESDLDTLQTLADQLAVAMENARLYEETKRFAITDGLTGLHNLRYFYEVLEKEIQRSERYHRSLSLIMLDLDDFKAYNDLYGHLAGDDLLIELAQLMPKVARRTDTLARYGGEEFAIILPETEAGEARFLAERLLDEVREHGFKTQDVQTIGRITISLGAATYPHHADSVKALVAAADKALLRAKRAGKNRLSVWEEELTELEPR